MEPVYEFDNKDIKEHRDIISHNCRLIEAQSISFLLYLDSKIDEETDLVKKEKLSNMMSSLSSQIDETTKLKSELLEAYKNIDSTYNNLKKMGFGDIIEEYYLATNVREQAPVMSNDNQIVNEEENVIDNSETYEEPVMEEEPVQEMTEEAVQEEVEEPVQEMVEEVPQEEVEEPVQEMAEEVEEPAQEVAEEAVQEEEPVMEEVAEEPVLVEESKDEAPEEVADGDNIEADEPVMVPEKEAPSEEVAEEPVIVPEEPVKNAEEENVEDNSEAVLIPAVETEEAVETPTEEATEEETPEEPVENTEEGPVGEVIIPAIDNTGAMEEEQAPEEEPSEGVAEEPVQEGATEEAPMEADSDVAIPVVEESPQEEAQSTEEKEAQVDESLEKFVKSDNNPVSRILVTENQYSELKKSLPKQEALLSAREKTNAIEVGSGLPVEEDPQAKIEKMMEEANNLYQSGDAAGAQALYEQISIENEKLKEQQLVK